jgi:hypothetical protein
MINIFKTFTLSIIFLPLFLEAGVNDLYVLNKQNTFDKWSKNFKFIEGEIYIKRDVKSIEIMEFKGKEKKNYSLFCVVKYREDSVVFLNSKDIDGFRFKEEHYQTNALMDESFFMHQVSFGKVTLFEKKSIPSDGRYLFFLKKNNKHVYYLLNPIESNITFLYTRTSATGSMLVEVETKMLNESFKKFVNMQMGDCLEVRNFVRSEFYKMEDLAFLVDKYNDCFLNDNNIK